MPFGDFNGDGRSDQLVIDAAGVVWIRTSDGERLSAGQAWFSGAPIADDWMLGDFNGDGRTDLMAIGADPIILLADDFGFGIATEWLFETAPEGTIVSSLVASAPSIDQPLPRPSPFVSGPSLVGDFNGDGLSDLLVERADGAGVDVLLSNGSGFVRTAWSDITPADLAKWQVGDFDGDGRDDILRTSLAGTEVHLSNGQSFGAGTVWTGAGLLAGTRWTVGDFNGDGKDDLYRYNPFSLDDDVFLSNGQAFYGGGKWNPLSRVSLGEIETLDLSGNGKSDLFIGGELVLVNDGANLSVQTLNADNAPTTIGLPKVMVEGGAFTVEVDKAGRYDCTIYDPSTGQVLAYYASLDQSTRVELGAGYRPGQFYEIRLNSIGDTVSMTSSFKIVSREAAAGLTASLDRFDIEYHGNQARPFFEDDRWKAEVHSFGELADRFDTLFAERASAAGDGTAADMAKALFLMQCVNQMWGYGNPVEATLPGRVIRNEAFSITSLDQIDFELYRDSPIGDCQDFAALTAFVLTRAGIENRIVLTTGHVFNEAFVDGAWIVLDSTLGIAYDRSYAEVLDPTVGTRLLDFGRASAVAGSTRYRDLISDFYSRKIMFDAAGLSSDPQIMSVDDFYDYIIDGFIYREALGEIALPPGFEAAPIAHGYNLNAVEFTDFYNHLASFDRFEVSYATAPARSGDALTSIDDLAFALAITADALSTTDPLGRVTALAGTARANWDIGLKGVEDALVALAEVYRDEGFSVRTINAAGSTFVELIGAEASFVIDLALGLVYSGDYGDMMRSTRVPVSVLAASDGDVDSIAPLPTADALIANFVKLQLGVFADFTAVTLDAAVGASFENVVAGSAAADRLVAEPAATYLHDAAGGDDVLVGGAADDRLTVARSADAQPSSVILSGGAGADAIRFAAAGGQQAATIDGGEGDDLIFVRSAVLGPVAVSGGAGSDLIYVSGSADSVVDGGDGNDVLNLAIGQGSIDVTLGGGSDRVVLYADGSPATGAPAIVRDFAVGATGDRLDLSALIGLLPEALRSTPFALDGLRLVESERGTLLQIAAAGGGGTRTLAVLEGVAVLDLNPFNLDGQVTGATLRGTVLADSLTGTDDSDLLLGGGGDDRLDGGGGADLMEGGDGNDTYHVDRVHDVVVETETGGDDLIVTTLDSYDLGWTSFVERLAYAGTGNFVGRGDAAANSLSGGGGDDHLMGGGGDDVLSGGTGNDILDGGAGSDIAVVDADRSAVRVEVDGSGFRLLTPAGSVRLIDIEAVQLSDGIFDLGLDGRLAQRARERLLLSAGDDVYVGGDSSDDVRGQDGNDVLRGELGSDLLDGGGGRDRLYGGDGDDRLLGGALGDVLYGGSGNDTLAGGEDDDFLSGEDGDDALDGGDGSDQLLGGDGTDRLVGDLGNDRLDGGAGDDALYGGAGRDVLIGNLGLDTIDGGEDDDYLNGGSGDDRLDGGDGDDQLFGEIGNDVIAGSAGRDKLYGGDGDDTLDGGDGEDVVIGAAGADRLNGGAGNDYLNGVGDNDILNGDDGDDQLFGDGGDDVLFGGSGRDRLDGGEGDDTLDGGLDRDILIGRGGSDTASGGDADDYLSGGDAGDVLAGDGGDDQLFGGADDDQLSGGAGRDWLDGGDGSDRLWGAADGDILLGAGGDDTANGDAGDDYLNGGADNDTLGGGDGDDHLFGEAGDDSLDGESGTDWIDGGAGNDLLRGGSDADFLLGRDGADRLEGGAGSDYLHGGSGIDTVFGDAGRDVLIGGEGDDVLSGGDDADQLQGGADNDQLSGDDGDDALYGDAGEDLLSGGAGADYLIGGTGNDRLIGGTGTDIFIFATGDGSDVVEDFGADDRIGLSMFGSFTQVLLHSREENGVVIIDLGAGEMLTLESVSLAQLQESDFFFI